MFAFDFWKYVKIYGVVTIGFMIWKAQLATHSLSFRSVILEAIPNHHETID